MARTHWDDLNPDKKALVLVVGGLDVACKLAAWHHLYHDDADQIRGSKKAWTLVSMLGGGSLVFLLFGRRKG